MENNNTSFWPSYVDIMTTLFAIMVVLFAVSYSRFRIKETELKKLADKYEVSWSSLIIVDYDKYGKEQAKNMTEFGFANARTASDNFKKGIKEQINRMLNN